MTTFKQFLKFDELGYKTKKLVNMIEEGVSEDLLMEGIFDYLGSYRQGGSRTAPTARPAAPRPTPSVAQQPGDDRMHVNKDRMSQLKQPIPDRMNVDQDRMKKFGMGGPNYNADHQKMVGKFKMGEPLHSIVQELQGIHDFLNTIEASNSPSGLWKDVGNNNQIVGNVGKIVKYLNKLNPRLRDTAVTYGDKMPKPQPQQDRHVLSGEFDRFNKSQGPIPNTGNALDSDFF